MDGDFVARHGVRAGASLRAFVRGARGALTAYRLPSPAPSERNTIFNSAEKAARERYLSSPFVQEFFPKLGFRGQEQIRVLICDGPRLLTWLGAFRSQAFGEREAERLKMLIEPLAKRLALEEKLGRLTLRGAALDVAMEALGGRGEPLRARRRLLVGLAGGGREGVGAG